MEKNPTQKKWLRHLLLALGCLATATALQAANVTVDGINYTTSGNKATVAKYTIDKTVTPYDTLFYTGDIVIPEVITDWMRRNSPPMQRAKARSSMVLPVPGRSSSRTWPEAIRQTPTRRMVSSLPRMTLPQLSSRRSRNETNRSGFME